MFGAAGATFIAVGALVSTLGTMSVNMLGAPRLLFAMADHRQLPRSISNVHPRFRTPYVAILLYAAMVLVLTLAGTFASSATISTVTRLVTYAVTCAALPILRRKDIEQAAAFRVRGGVVVSIAALILTAWLLTGSTWSEAQQVLIAAAAGLVFHVAFSRRRR
jgi:amino acid transporter